MSPRLGESPGIPLLTLMLFSSYDDPMRQATVRVRDRVRVRVDFRVRARVVVMVRVVWCGLAHTRVTTAMVRVSRRTVVPEPVFEACERGY